MREWASFNEMNEFLICPSTARQRRNRHRELRFQHPRTPVRLLCAGIRPRFPRSSAGHCGERYSACASRCRKRAASLDTPSPAPDREGHRSLLHRIFTGRFCETHQTQRGAFIRTVVLIVRRPPCGPDSWPTPRRSSRHSQSCFAIRSHLKRHLRQAH